MPWCADREVWVRAQPIGCSLQKTVQATGTSRLPDAYKACWPGGLPDCKVGRILAAISQPVVTHQNPITTGVKIGR